MTYDALVALLGSGFERRKRVVDAGRIVGEEHIGWRWACDCQAFVRPEKDYLWVPCGRHDRRPSPS